MTNWFTCAWAQGVSLALILVFPSARTLAQGTITYGVPPTPIYYAPVGSRTTDMDLDGDGNADYTLISDSGQTVLQPRGNNSFIILPATPPDIGSFVAALGQGDLIDAALSSLNPRYAWYDVSTDPVGASLIAAMNTSGSIGYFFGGIHYVGLSFDFGGGRHFGWMRIDSPSPDVAFGQLLDWAYETRPGASIFAGAVPEPSSFALFGIGGLALLWIHRRRRTTHSFA